MDKIVAESNVERLRREKAEWEAESVRRAELRKQEDAQYDQALKGILDPIENYLREGLKKYDRLNFEIDIDDNVWPQKYRGASIRIRCNDSYKLRHDINTAMSWNFDVKLDADGNVLKESGSWSGLNATTEDSLISLRQTLEALEFLNSVDYSTLLNVDIPDYSDFISDESSPRTYEKPKFDQLIKEAELDEYVGSGIALRGTAYSENDPEYFNNTKLWYMILRATEKQYQVARFTDWDISYKIKQGMSFDEAVQDCCRWTNRAKKERVLEALDYPYQEISEDEVLNSKYF